MFDRAAFSLHHHELRRPLLGGQRLSVGRVEPSAGHLRLTAHSCQRMTFAEHFPSDLEVIVRKHLPTLKAREAPRMELLVHVAPAAGGGRFQILPLNAAMATVT